MLLHKFINKNQSKAKSYKRLCFHEKKTPFEFNPTRSLTENMFYSFICKTTTANIRFSMSNSNFKGGYDGGDFICNTANGINGRTVSNTTSNINYSILL